MRQEVKNTAQTSNKNILIFDFHLYVKSAVMKPKYVLFLSGLMIMESKKINLLF